MSAQASTAGGPPTGLLAFQSRRKQGTRERLLRAAAEAFGARGYVAVPVEEIALAAGVSRMTFYRHFGGKAELAAELFRTNARDHLPAIASIGSRDFHNREVVRAWMAGIFSADREQRALLQAFVQASVIEPVFAKAGHSFIDDVIAAFGVHIPAFALDPGVAAHRRRYVEARLLIYELLDQSNHAARDRGVGPDLLVLDVLTDRFLAFVAVGGPAEE